MTKTIKAGRPKSTEDKKLCARNILIYSRRFVEKASIPDLMKEFELSRSQIFEVLKIVSKEMGQVPEKIKLAGAIYSLEQRTKDLVRIRAEEINRGKQKSIRNISELEVQIRNNEELSLKLEGLLKEAISLEVKPQHSIRAILEALPSLPPKVH